MVIIMVNIGVVIVNILINIIVRNNNHQQHVDDAVAVDNEDGVDAEPGEDGESRRQ